MSTHVAEIAEERTKAKEGRRFSAYLVGMLATSVLVPGLAGFLAVILYLSSEQALGSYHWFINSDGTRAYGFGSLFALGGWGLCAAGARNYARAAGANPSEYLKLKEIFEVILAPAKSHGDSLDQPGNRDESDGAPPAQPTSTTIVSGDTVRTGVTAIVPHEGNVFQDKVPGAVFVGNAFGKLAGSTQVTELGTIETPIVLTNTLSVGVAIDAVVRYTIAQPGNETPRKKYFSGFSLDYRETAYTAGFQENITYVNG